MKYKYTLRLVENGAEVWKRWTGDIEEARRLAASAVVDLGAHDTLAASFLGALSVKELGRMVGDETWGFAVNSRDLTSTLHLEVYRKRQGTVTEYTQGG